MREIPKNSTDASESLIFAFKNRRLAKDFRLNFLKKGFSTKILPEALTWHFAGKWTHIKELDIKKDNYFIKSLNKIDKYVSLQIFYKMDKNYPNRIEQTIKDIL